jgi:hypothetical protein
MSMTRALAPLFVMLLLAAPGALAKSTALEAAPADTDFGLVIHGLGQLEPMLDEHVDTMKHYGLDAPDIEMFLDMIRDTSPRLKKTRGPLAAELGLTETGSLAIYALPGEAHAPQVVAVMDVKERKKVIKTVKWLLALDPTSDKSGKAKAKIKVKKERLPGKGLLMTFQKADTETSLYLRFQGDLAAFSDNLKAIDAVQFAGGEPFLGSGVLADARIGFYAGLNTAGAIAMKMLPPAAASVKTAQLYTLFQGGRYEAKLDVEVEPDFEPFLSVLRPGASGKAARAAMSKLITERTDAWWRISLDLKALETLASNLLGKGYEKIEAKFERRTGLPLDLVNRSITGDQLVRCDGSFSSCVFTAGILDAGGAENLIRHFFAIVGDGLTENSTQEVSVETKSVSEAGEARHMVTTLSIRENLEKKAELLKEAHEWLRMDEKQRSLQDKLRAPQTEEENNRLNKEASALADEMRVRGLDSYPHRHPDSIEAAREEQRQAKASKGKKKKKKNNKAEPFQPILSIHWGMTDKLVIFGTTPQAIQTAMKASSESAPAASGGKLDDLTFVGGYQARGGLSDVIRQAVPVLRGLLPKDFIGGSVIRMIDGLLVLHDEAVDGESSMRVSPTNVTLHGVATSLPTKGQKDYSATISEAYTQAMRDRYAGDIAQSNELLAKLALEHPNTPWGQKAKGMVFRTDLTGMFVNLGYLGALGNNPIAHKLIRQMEQAIAPMIRGF